MPNVVYSCGGIVHDGRLWMPHGDRRFADRRRLGRRSRAARRHDSPGSARRSAPVSISLVDPQVVVDHPVDAEPVGRPGPHGGAGRAARPRRHGGDRRRHVRRRDSRSRPRRRPRASTRADRRRRACRRPSPRPPTARTARRRRSGAAGPRRRPAPPPAARGPTEPEVDDPVAVDVRLHLLGEVALVLHDAADDQPAPGRGGRSRSPPPCPCPGGSGRRRPDRRRRWPERQLGEVDAVVDGRHVVQLGRRGRRRRWRRSATGRAGRPAGCRRRRSRGWSSPSAPRAWPRRPAAASPAGCARGRTRPTAPARGHVQRLPDPPVHRRVLGVAVRADAVQRAPR